MDVKALVIFIAEVIHSTAEVGTINERVQIIVRAAASLLGVGRLTWEQVRDTLRHQPVMVLLLQWNARSLLANGQELKHFIKELDVVPDVICVQETWLKHSFDFVIYGYYVIRHDRENGDGGGCVTFIKSGLPYRLLGIGGSLECIVVEIWDRGEPNVIITFYNPCLRLELQRLLDIHGQDRRKVIWCGDFNVHNNIWGGRHVDANGKVLEDLMEERDSVSLNDGTTRFNVLTGRDSVLDSTLVSNVLEAANGW